MKKIIILILICLVALSSVQAKTAPDAYEAQLDNFNFWNKISLYFSSNIRSLSTLPNGADCSAYPDEEGDFTATSNQFCRTSNIEDGEVFAIYDTTGGGWIVPGPGPKLVYGQTGCMDTIIGHSYHYSVWYCRITDYECVDTDGGLDFYVFGETMYNNQRMADYCVGNKLYEYYCQSPPSEAILVESRDCTIENNFICENAQCIYKDPGGDCEAGWKCKDSNNMAYQQSNCQWASQYSCENGCSNDKCNLPPETKCSDGTSYGQCSSDKPLYCDNGNLLQDCVKCGCSTGLQCVSGQCTPQQSCDNECSSGQKICAGTTA